MSLINSSSRWKPSSGLWLSSRRVFVFLNVQYQFSSEKISILDDFQCAHEIELKFNEDNKNQVLLELDVQ
jgi:hypothetical protein